MASSPILLPPYPTFTGTTNTNTDMATSPPSSPSSNENSTSTRATNITSSPPSSASGTGNTTSTDRYSHEPFSTFQRKVHDLCVAIGLGTPIAVAQMKGGSNNRVISLALPNLPPAIIRIPRFAGGVLQGIRDQHAVASFLRGTAISVPETIAYDTTTRNRVESEYIIQRRIPGVPLADIYHSLEMSERERILRQVIDILVEMENVQFPAAGQLVATGCLPDALVVNRSDRCHSPGVAAAPFPTGFGEYPQPGPTPTTLEDAFADRFRAWDTERETPLGKVVAPMFARLEEIIVEMRGLGFFEECSVAPNVLHHWDFQPRNIMVEGRDDGYKVSGLLDWDEVLSVPLVLARKPPAWLWLPEGRLTSSQDVDEWELGPAELRTLFEREMEKRVGSKYVEDAFGKGRWIRRVWGFLLDGFQRSEDFKQFKRFIEEWNSYRRGKPAT